MEYKDYYKTLGVPRGANQDEIKRAYRPLARKLHPDVSKEPNAEARFKELGEAYEVLKDPKKRAAYDQLGADWKSGQEFRPPPEWQAGHAQPGAGFGEGDGADFSDFFESLFGRGFGGGRPGRVAFDAPGEDRHAKVAIELEDAYLGATRTITMRVPEGDGRGHIALTERTLNVTIPRGVRAGQQIRLAGQGAPGRGKGPAGDLYLEIDFRPHARYRVDERDVHVDLPIAPWEAALGATVKLPTPGGSVELKIPAGSASGGKLRLKGRGIPGNPPGDFYAVLEIVAPAAAGEADQAFYRDMAERFKSFDPRTKPGA